MKGAVLPHYPRPCRRCQYLDLERGLHGVGVGVSGLLRIAARLISGIIVLLALTAM
jgi:hypothetical protein